MLNYIRLFFLIAIGSIVLVVFSTQAEKLTEQALNAIQNMENKQQALIKLDDFLKDPSLTPIEKISVLKTKSTVYFSLENFYKAIKTAKEEQQLANKYNFLQLEAQAYKRIGVFSYYKGEIPNAIQAYQQALSYFLTIDDPIQQANLYNNIALAEMKLANLEKALELFTLAAKRYQEFGSEADKVDVNYNIATLYINMNRYELAKENFEQVIEQRKKLNDALGVAKAQADLGIAYEKSGDYQQAEKFYLMGLAYLEEKNVKYEMVIIYLNLAELYNITNKVDLAIKYANKAIKLSLLHKNDDHYSMGLYLLALAKFSQGNYQQALDLAKQALHIAKKVQSPANIIEIHGIQSLIYSALNDPKQAIAHYRAFIKGQIDQSNNQLNSQLASYDSGQLKQQVSQLKQQKRLQELEIERSAQQRNFVVIVIVGTLLVIFFVVYQRTSRKSTLELESKVKQRTNELEFLMQELKSANNVKSQFLANMSHEIRTPLTTVIGQAEAIINGDIPVEHIAKEVDIIHGNSLHLLELTNNILDLSKIEANKIDLELKKQNLHEILQQLANMFTRQATKKGLNFKVTHTLPDPFYVEIDSFRVKQILINLCSNAIKFTPKGHVELTLTLKKSKLIFKISDSGIGMSRAQLQSVFDSFTQGDSSISRRFGGTGLGLCLSDQLAKIMGGSIDVESELNYGSDFVFTLPCKEYSCDDNTENKTVLPSVEQIVAEKSLTGKIVLADDHQDNRRLIARLLESLGLEVITARNGSEAISLVEHHKPEVILMDIQMPEIDGIEAFKILRQKGCEIPILALTANAMSHEIEYYLSLGFDGHLSKPIEREIFIPMITKYYDGSLTIEEADEKFADVDMTDLVQQFKSNLALEQKDLILHINNHDEAYIAKLSHRIAGAAQMFGFADLSETAIQLEKAIKKDETKEIHRYTQQLLNEIDQVLW